MNAHPGTLGYSNSRCGNANVSKIGGVGTAFPTVPAYFKHWVLSTLTLIYLADLLNFGILWHSTQRLIPPHRPLWKILL